MELFAVIAVLVFIAIAAFFFFENAKLHKRVVTLDEQLREAQSRKPAKAEKSESKKPEQTVTVSTDPELERDLDDARAEIKDLKKQIYDIKKGSKELKQQVKEASEDRGSDLLDSDMVFELREEVAELRADKVRLEDAVKAAKQTSRPEPPPRKEEPAAAPAPVVVAPTGDADVDAMRAKYEKELDTLRQESRDLDRKLKSTASNVDKQRRRADNNDRAYKITQRQYDAAQERVELLDAQLKKAGIVPLTPPEPAPPVVKPAGPVSRPAPTPEPVEEVAAPVAVTPEEPAPEVEPAPPTPPATPAIPPVPSILQGSAMVRPKPKPEVGSTTVLSPMALASAAVRESEDKGSDTISHAKPVASTDVAPERAPADPKPEPKVIVATPADESGGHTAVLTPGAIAASMTPVEEEKSEPPADESGGHTAVLSAASLSRVVTSESAVVSVAAEESEPAEEEEAASTAIFSPAAFAKADAPDPAPKVEPRKDEEGGRRPSSGLFGMPDDLLSTPPEEEQDPVRTTQFAFPAQLMGQSDTKSSSRLGGGGDFENPADKPVPDADSEVESQDNRLGGSRLGDIDLGDIGSAIDDAWGDLDVD